MNEIFYLLDHMTTKKEIIAFLVYNTTTIRFTFTAKKRGMVLIIHWINKNIKGFFQLSPGNINIIRFIFLSFFFYLLEKSGGQIKNNAALFNSEINVILLLLLLQGEEIFFYEKVNGQSKQGGGFVIPNFKSAFSPLVVDYELKKDKRRLNL